MYIPQTRAVIFKITSNDTFQVQHNVYILITSH